MVTSVSENNIGLLIVGQQSCVSNHEFRFHQFVLTTTFDSCILDTTSPSTTPTSSAAFLGALWFLMPVGVLAHLQPVQHRVTFRYFFSG